MKDDIIRFRKLCDILIKEKGYNKNRVVLESKLTWPTLKKVLEEPIDEIKIQSSVLGLIQDYCKVHKDDFTYAGIKSEPIPEREIKIVSEIKKEDFGTIMPEGHNKPEKVNGSDKKEPEGRTVEAELQVSPDLVDQLIDLIKKIPSNVSIEIVINRQ